MVPCLSITGGRRGGEVDQWKRRYFRMRFADLEYYLSAASICPKGTIKLDASSELILEPTTLSFVLKCQVGWSVGRSVGRWVGRSVGRLVNSLVGWWAAGLVRGDWLAVG